MFAAFAADVGVTVDGLKSSPSRFFRLDYRWKDTERVR